MPRPVPVSPALSPSAPGSGAIEGSRMAMEFEMGKAKPQQTLEKLARILDEDGIPYAVVGALALFEYGYRRVTVDVDLLLSETGLARFKEAHLGRGYAERFSGGRGVIDTETRVSIDFLISGDYPGFLYLMRDQRCLLQKPDDDYNHCSKQE